MRAHTRRFAASCTAYDARGNTERSATLFFLPVAASAAAGRGAIITAMAYDTLGRKIAQHDPETIRNPGSGLVLTHLPWRLNIAKCPARCESSSMVPSIT